MDIHTKYIYKQGGGGEEEEKQQQKKTNRKEMVNPCLNHLAMVYFCSLYLNFIYLFIIIFLKLLLLFFMDNLNSSFQHQGYHFPDLLIPKFKFGPTYAHIKSIHRFGQADGTHIFLHV